MTNEELKEALFTQSPVVAILPTYGEIEYDRVSAIIYRVINGKLTISAELFDASGHSVTIAAAEAVRLKTPNTAKKEG